MDRFNCKRCGSELEITGKGFLMCNSCKLKFFLASDGNLHLLEKK